MMIVESPESGTISLPGSTVEFVQVGRLSPRRAPILGEHTEEILADLRVWATMTSVPSMTAASWPVPHRRSRCHGAGPSADWPSRRLQRWRRFWYRFQQRILPIEEIPTPRTRCRSSPCRACPTPWKRGRSSAGSFRAASGWIAERT